jgi:hypothetical protein
MLGSRVLNSPKDPSISFTLPASGLPMLQMICFLLVIEAKHVYKKPPSSIGQQFSFKVLVNGKCNDASDKDGLTKFLNKWFPRIVEAKPVCHLYEDQSGDCYPDPHKSGLLYQGNP